jgi:hypothetical protein
MPKADLAGHDRPTAGSEDTCTLIRRRQRSSNRRSPQAEPPTHRLARSGQRAQRCRVAELRAIHIRPDKHLQRKIERSQRRSRHHQRARLWTPKDHDLRIAQLKTMSRRLTAVTRTSDDVEGLTIPRFGWSTLGVRARRREVHFGAVRCTLESRHVQAVSASRTYLQALQPDF